MNTNQSKQIKNYSPLTSRVLGGSKSSSKTFFLLLVLITLFIVFSLYINLRINGNNNEFKAPPNNSYYISPINQKPSGMLVPSPTSTPYFSRERYEDIEKLIPKSNCEELIKNWSFVKDSSQDLFLVEIPNYFTLQTDWGGQNFSINNPQLGKFKINTFVHNYYQNAYSGSKLPKNYSNATKISSLIYAGQNLNSINKFYKDGNDVDYLIGDNKIIITKNNTSAIWGFSINADLDSQHKPKELVETDDFKCFIRSIELLETNRN